MARFNLGSSAGLLAAAALLADYILTAAVGISAGVGALISAVPSLLPHTVSMCVGILIVITILNLRGVREAGAVFAVPTYLFVGTLLITIVAGVIRVLLSGGHPNPVVALPPPPAAAEAVTYWLLLKAFSSGCTAMTGVEAVSNGVKGFPRACGEKRAAYLDRDHFSSGSLAGRNLVSREGLRELPPPTPAAPVIRAFSPCSRRQYLERDSFYYLTIGSILIVLSLSANTAFADFPRLCRAIAQNNYLPHVFGYRGRRLVYTYGIVVLALLCAGVLLLFGGITDLAYPALCRGCVPGFHAFASGHGHALEEKSRPALGEECLGKWSWEQRLPASLLRLSWLRSLWKVPG